MSKKEQYFYLIGLSILSLIIRMALLDYSYVRVIEADGVSYVNGAKGFLDGFDISKINIIDQPLFPILIAFFSWIAPDWETAGRMVSMTAGSLIGPLVFLISNAKKNPLKVSIFSSLIAAITPIYVTASFQVFSDTLNCLLLLFAFWQLIVALRDGRGINFFLSGAGFALAYLTRHDSIVPAFFAFLVLAYHLFSKSKGKGRWIRFSLFAASFVIIAFPYVLFIHSQLGVWAISGRHAGLQKSFSSAKAISGGGNENYEELIYGLTQDLDVKSDPLLSKLTQNSNDSILASWIRDPVERFHTLSNNLKTEWDVFISSVPWYLIILTIVAVFSQRRKFVKDNLPLFAYSSPLLFLYPLFWADPRHLFHFFLPIWLWAAEGIEHLSSFAPRQSFLDRTVRNLPYSEILKYLIYFAILVAMIFPFKPKVLGRNQLSYLRQKEMGIWISKNTPKEAVVMTRWGRIAFYTERKTVLFPYAEWNAIKRYMKKNGVTHLVLDEWFFEYRPQVRHLLSPIFSGSSASPDNALSIIRLKRDRFGGMIVYEVKNN